MSFFIKFIYFVLLTSTFASAAWVSNFGTNAPSDSAVNLDVNKNFQLLYGGGNSSIYGDFAATGDSILSVPDSESSLAFADSDYMLSDNSFGSHPDVRKRNSSSATLNLPSYVEGKHVVFAGLFWQGMVHEQPSSNPTTTDVDAAISGWNKISLKTPDGITHNLTASLITKNTTNKTYHYTYKDNNSFHHHYSAYVNVTDLVKNTYTSIENTFTAGHILTTQGQDFGDNMYFAHEPQTDGLWITSSGIRMGYYGGWSLIVVYSLDQETRKAHPEEKLKNISIYDGYDQFAIWANTDPLLVSVDINDFLTPKTGPIDSKLLIFGGGGDYSIGGDRLNIYNQATNSFEAIFNALNTNGEQFNSSYTYLNNHLTSKQKRNGVDLDTYDISNKMTNNQTSTTIQFGVQQLGSSADQIHPQVIGFSTELYEPQLCYDYSYEQKGIFFTEDNNGTKFPSIVGDIDYDENIGVKIYLRNSENSDISANNLTFNILDINTSQAIYTSNSTSVVYPREVHTTALSDNDLNVSNSYIKDINLQNMQGQQSSYIYYSLTPVNNINDINISINAELSFDLVLDDGNTFHYDNQKLGSSNIPLCTADNFEYAPIKGRFNVVHNDFYNNLTKYYNIPTQVTKREGNFKVLSLDPNNLDILQDLNHSTIVAVDLIDVSAFHDTTASCEEETSAISKKVWVIFDQNTHETSFDKTTLQNAISGGMTELTSTTEFYQEANQNTAFRISYNMADDNGSLVQINKITSGAHTGNFQIINFTELAQGLEDYNDHLPQSEQNKCVQPIVVGNKTYTTMPESCGNASATKGIDSEQLTICMQCVYGIQTKFFCSRDNFSIRPDAFSMTISDQNQSTGTNKTKLDNNHYATATTSPRTSDLAAGYNYVLDVIATNFTDNLPASGYTKEITPTIIGDSADFVWDPRSNPINCNDTNDSEGEVSFLNGTHDDNVSVDQVGEYKGKILDTTWTVVDHDPTLMTHHTGSFFLNPNTSDCTQNSSVVQGINVNALNGCNISSEHNNSISNLFYKDYQVTFHPYKFNLDSLIVSRGADLNQTLNSFIYTSNVENNASREMALHVRGIFAAQGENNSTLSNFVAGCYAKDVNLTMNRVMEAIVEPYVARFTDRNSTANIISDTFREVNATNNLFTVLDGNFSKDMNGQIDMLLDLNFEKNITVPREPVQITLNSFDVNCTDITECEFQADLINNKHTKGIINLNDVNLTHYYGRVHAPDYEFEENTGTARIFYEAYCETCDQDIYNISGEESPDSIFWYLNNLHNNIGNGQVITFATQEGVTFNGATTTNSTNISAGSESQILIAPRVPYVDRVTMEPDPWLLYNRFNNNALTNDFNVKFLDVSSGWAGEGELGQTIDLNVSTIQNRRLDW